MKTLLGWRARSLFADLSDEAARLSDSTELAKVSPKSWAKLEALWRRRFVARRIMFLIVPFLFASLVPSDARADLLAEAKDAGRDGIPEVAITKLTTYLQGSVPLENRVEAKLLLARSLIETSRPKEALVALADPELPPSATQLMTGEAALLTGEWLRAKTAFQQAISVSRSTESSEKAVLGLAQAEHELQDENSALSTLLPLLERHAPNPLALLLAAQIEIRRGELDKAASRLEQIPPSAPLRENLYRFCFEGEIALQRHDYDRAAKFFDQVLTAPIGRSTRLRVLAQLNQAKVLIARNELDAAESSLVHLIDELPQTPLLPELMETLAWVDFREQDSSQPELHRWAEDSPQVTGTNRPAYSLYYLGRLQIVLGAKQAGQAALQQVIARFPDHPAADLASISLAQAQLQTGDSAGAIQTLSGRIRPTLDRESSEKIFELLAEAKFRAGDAAGAKHFYDQLVALGGAKADPAVFNSALCSLALGDEAEYEPALARLRQDGQDALVAELEFARGLLEAKRGRSSAATKNLAQFIHDFPVNDRISSAHLILAELKYRAKTPDLPGAEAELTKVKSQDDTEHERQALLQFYLAASDPKKPLSDISRLAEDFLRDFPDSSAKADVRLKLGELYFNRNDYVSAQNQFQAAADENPDSPLVETALFLAGESARKTLNPASVDNAVAIFEEVYRLNGALRLQARLAEALTKRQLLQESEAIVILDDLLGQQPGPELRAEALENKGDAEFSLGAKDPAKYQEAMKTYQLLADDDQISTATREAALYKIGRCYQELGHPDEALTSFYNVLNLPGTDKSVFWYYRAGFDAADILEKKHSWNSAASVYEKLASDTGPRAQEAKTRLERLRLEHFLWSE
ncbi:MAG: tetratricopeptide repeat protein [Verrucomicrobia bacterium]|nr:tetratricopeptide repeat protein [Verrucomicrobiota bacterium]